MATKSDLVAKVTKKHCNLSKIVVKTIIGMVFEMLSSALKSHNRIEIRGVGSFSIRGYNLRISNRLMSQKFTKDQYFTIYFRSSKKLSELINK